MKFSLTTCLSIVTAVNAFPIFNSFANNGKFSELEMLHQEVFDSVAGFADAEYLPGQSKSLPPIDTEALQALIDEEGLRLGAETLYNLSLSSVKKYGNPTRVIGSKGHWKTLHYIMKELHKLKGYYKVWVQPFHAFDSKILNTTLSINGTEIESVKAFRLTPPTFQRKPVSSGLVLASEYGCSLEDFPSNSAGNIVLVKRGVCSFNDKSVNAGESGAIGVVIFDSEGSLSGTLETPIKEQVATVGVAQSEVQSFIDALTTSPEAALPVTLLVDSYVNTIRTINVLAETVKGNHSNVIALGAHSDSVSEGPGINDDGSGSISLLEVARKLSNFEVNNAVRFAWWAAEEEGLLGSLYYAKSLTPEENSQVRLFMDYDMMASPNYEYQVYDANNVDHPKGSEELKNLYIDWYTAHGLNYSLIPFDGRSDYVGFINAGIPAGGVATGAEGVKNEEGVEKFGGVAGEWFDQCYHQLCDNTTNPDYEAWVVNTKLIAHSVAVYANSTDELPPREPAFIAEAAKNNFIYRGSELAF